MRLLVCDDIMTSSERKELRYQRRQKRRVAKILERSNMYADINKAFCFHKVMYYANKLARYHTKVVVL